MTTFASLSKAAIGAIIEIDAAPLSLPLGLVLRQKPKQTFEDVEALHRVSGSTMQSRTVTQQRRTALPLESLFE
jgi:hypothetical protein